MSYANRYRLTASGLKRRERERRCAGRWSDYLPWIFIHEISSRGWSTRAWSEKMQRVIHLLSRLEYLFFLRLEFSRDVVEFYEQFRVPFDAAKAIALEHRFPYPRDPFTEQEIHMTSDFVIRRDDGSLVIRSVKPKEEKERERVRQKLYIEKLYWTQVGGAESWATIGREQLCSAIDTNIAWVWRMRSPAKLTTSVSVQLDRARQLARVLILDEALTLRETAEELGRKFGTRGDGTALLRHFLAAGDFPEADFSVEFRLDHELPLLRSRQTSHGTV